jgi:lysozyme family protein
MDRNFKRSLQLVLKREGSWSDHPKDPGGATMKGVTLANFRNFVKPGATKDDLRKITDEQVATVYRRFYWDKVAGAELPDGVDYAVFDFAVNSGPDRAVKYLQAIVGVPQDGKIGPATIKATRSRMHAGVINLYCDKRPAFLKGLKTWPTFGKGWAARVKSTRIDALDMSTRPTPENPTVIERKVEVEVEKPVVPAKVEKEVRQKTNWLSGIFGGLFGAGGLSAWFAGMDKDSLILVGGIAVVVIVVMLIGGEWIIRRIRSIKQAVEE